MNIFDILRDHARQRPDELASSSPRHRLTTYRKLWSRIERASARLDGEWLIGQGDVVAYYGCGHADALILWLALARLGAVLLPLETQTVQSCAGEIMERLQVRVLLHDDDLPPLPGDGQHAIFPLSVVVAQPCDHRPAQLPERSDQPCLVTVMERIDGVRTMPPSCQYLAIDEMINGAVHETDIGHGPLFDPERLRRSVLPALIAGAHLKFS